MGLSICHSIVQRHGGHIEAQSVIEKGTAFTFYIPVSDKQPSSPPEQGGDLPTETGRILVMDDEEAVRRTAGRMLEELGYEVGFTVDGDEAIDACAAAEESEKSFHLVMMDLTIPGGMGGKETVVKLHEIAPHARAIVASGYANDPVLTDPAAYGFVAGIRKPIDLDELAAVVAEAMGS